MPRIILDRYRDITSQTIVGDTGLKLCEWLEYWQYGNADLWADDGIDLSVSLKLCHELCAVRMIVDRLIGNPPCDGENA